MWQKMTDLIWIACRLSSFPENNPRHAAGLLRLAEVDVGNLQLDNRLVDTPYKFPVMLITKQASDSARHRN